MLVVHLVGVVGGTQEVLAEQDHLLCTTAEQAAQKKYPFVPDFMFSSARYTPWPNRQRSSLSLNWDLEIARIAWGTCGYFSTQADFRHFVWTLYNAYAGRPRHWRST